MLKLGIIGTGQISHEFIKAAKLSGHYELQAVYSRSLTSAQAFAQDYQNVELFSDLTDFLKSSLDVVYIASPNSLHFEQAKQVILAGKHAIIEKPAVSLPEEWKELVALSKQEEVCIFEAARNYHEEAFATIQGFLKDKTVWGAHFTFAKYSSKMQALLSGKEPNVFSAKFSGGALMDLGVYPVYAAIRLFGSPQSARYSAQQLPNTVDLNGVGALIYPDFQVGIQAGKNINSNLPAEIYTDQGTLTLDSIEFISSAIFQGLDGQETILPIQQASHTMQEEAKAFATVLLRKDRTAYEEWLKAASAVHQTLWTMRKDAGIRFEVDYD